MRTPVFNELFELWHMINMTDTEIEAYFETKRNAIINANPLDYAEVHYWKGKRLTYSHE